MIFSASEIPYVLIVKSSSRKIGYMVNFECDRCGKCCRSYGEFIKIERQLGGCDYYCRFGITRELFLVHVQPEYAETISEEYEQQDRQGSDNNQKKCIFLQKDRQGDGFTCAIYPSRPLICREFQCYRMLIYDHNGHLCGRVIGRNELRTSDNVLSNLWKEEVVHLFPLPPSSQQLKKSLATESHIHGSHVNDSDWVNKILIILKAHGYRGDPVE